MRRVPGRVEYNDAIGGHQVDAEASGFGRNEEEAGPQIVRAVEVVGPHLAQFSRRGAVQTEVVGVQRPSAQGVVLTHKKRVQSLKIAPCSIQLYSSSLALLGLVE